MSWRKKVTFVALTAFWVGTVVLCFGALGHYSLEAGASATPTGGAVPWLRAHQRAGRPLLAMVVHPLCPCTDASLAELRDFMVRSAGRCDVLVVQVSAATAQPVDDTIAGTTITAVRDPDGRIAQLLGAETSGDALLLGADGHLHFHGGITIARGHRGESPAQGALLDLVAGQPNPLCFAPVYGCSLSDPERRRTP